MSTLPYVSAPGNVPKALEAIQKAATPKKVTGDFVKSILKIPGGSGDQILSYLKKIGFAGTDGTPTALYTKFRNPTTAGIAAAEAIKTAYAALYKHNEYMHTLSNDELIGLVVQETGKSHDETAVGLIVSAISGLKKFADFNAANSNDMGSKYSVVERENNDEAPTKISPEPTGIGLNLGYTINLNLPATTDITVFNAIFKSLKENLLSTDDA